MKGCWWPQAEFDGGHVPWNTMTSVASRRAPQPLAGLSAGEPVSADLQRGKRPWRTYAAPSGVPRLPISSRTRSSAPASPNRSHGASIRRRCAHSIADAIVPPGANRVQNGVVAPMGGLSYRLSPWIPTQNSPAWPLRFCATRCRFITGATSHDGRPAIGASWASGL